MLLIMLSLYLRPSYYSTDILLEFRFDETSILYSRTVSSFIAIFFYLLKMIAKAYF